VNGPARQSDWIAGFLAAQAAELNAAKNTLLSYGRDLSDFSEWLGRRGSDFAVVQEETIEAYLIDQTTFSVCLRRRLARHKPRAENQRAGAKPEPSKDLVDSRGGSPVGRGPR
jgi:hypothetical protein